MLCHGLDFDDTHSDSVSHVSVVVCPAALATAEAQGSSGAELLAAIVAGNEVVTRVGTAASGLFHARGFHPTAICGIFGGTAAVGAADRRRRRGDRLGAGDRGLVRGRPLRLPRRRDRDEAVPPGVGGARLDRSPRGSPQLGGEGPPGVLEGRFGLYHAFLGAEKGEIPIDEQLADLGSRWETPRIAYKPYPACHFIHGSLGATAGLSPLDPDEIEDVLVDDPGGGRLARARARRARRSRRARSTRRSSASSTRRRRCSCTARAGLSAYSDEAIADPKVLELARARALRDEGVPDLPGGVPRRRADHDARRHRARGRAAAPARRAREPALRRRGAREVPRERRARARRRRRSSRWRQAILSLERARRRRRACCASRFAA